MLVTKEELAEIFEVRDDFLRDYPDWRNGQALFNAIYYVNQDVGNKIRGSAVDPFHRDDKIDECIKYLKGE